MLSGDIKAEFFRRIIQIARHGDVSDGGFRSEKIRAPGQPLVDNCQCALGATFEKFEQCWLAERPREITEETLGTEIAADFLIVENDPAQCF